VFWNIAYKGQKMKTTLRSRPYTGLNDFIIMTSILMVGRKTSKRPYYIHTGDLSWWMFHDDHEESHWRESVRIWESNRNPIGWSMVDPEWYSFDVNLLPDFRSTKEETYILDWTIKKIEEGVRKNGGSKIRTVWISEFDDDRINQLEKRGFKQDDDFMWYLEYPLDAQIPEMRLPKDFIVRPIRGESEIQLRATASYDIVKSGCRYDEFWPRYQRFMRSPVYNPQFDIVTEAPDGQLASFCVVWPDPVNHIGLFEPVGANSNYMHMGLRKVVVTAGLKRLKACGMDQAMTCVKDNDSSAINFFEGVGFIKIHKLYSFVKNV
jgi:hypothetical protein